MPDINLLEDRASADELRSKPSRKVPPAKIEYSTPEHRAAGSKQLRKPSGLTLWARSLFRRTPKKPASPEVILPPAPKPREPARPKPAADRSVPPIDIFADLKSTSGGPIGRSQTPPAEPPRPTGPKPGEFPPLPKPPAWSPKPPGPAPASPPPAAPPSAPATPPRAGTFEGVVSMPKYRNGRQPPQSRSEPVAPTGPQPGEFPPLPKPPAWSPKPEVPRPPPVVPVHPAAPPVAPPPGRSLRLGRVKPAPTPRDVTPFGVNLLPEEMTRTFEPRQKLITLSLTVLASALVVGIAYTGLLVYRETQVRRVYEVRGQVNETAKKINALRKEQQQAISLKQTNDIIRQLLNQHVYWTKFLELFERSTLATVTYPGGISFNVSSTTLSLTGVAPDIATVNRQLSEYQAATAFTREARVDSVRRMTEAGATGYNFFIVIAVQPDVFLRPIDSPAASSGSPTSATTGSTSTSSP